MDGACENAEECYLGKLTETQFKAMIEDTANRAADRAVARAFEGLGLTDKEAKGNVRELIQLFRNYKDARRATRSAIWGFLKSAGKNLYAIGTKAAAIIALIYLLKKFGVDADKLEQLTKVVK